VWWKQNGHRWSALLFVEERREGSAGIRFASFDLSVVERCIGKSVMHAGHRLSVEEWAQGSAEGGQF